MGKPTDINAEHSIKSIQEAINRAAAVRQVAADQALALAQQNTGSGPVNPAQGPAQPPKSGGK